MTEKETDVLIVGAGPTGLVLGLCEPERIAFARRLVATTDQAFTGVTSDGTIARRVRLDIVPAVVSGRPQAPTDDSKPLRRSTSPFVG